jgi:hypothetical protein
MRVRPAVAALLAALAASLLAQGGRAADDARSAKPAPASNGACVTCHVGIEEMHPWAPVTCVTCHGGNADATSKDAAHVPRGQRAPGDERVLGPSFDLEYGRFVDPGSLRAAPTSCGPCHARAVADVTHSLHATTAGHLGDGLYENGVVSEKSPRLAVFDVRDDPPPGVKRPKEALAGLKQIDGFQGSGDRGKASTHFTDLPRKNCMQCHLWSRGRAVRGRAGMDGDYRGEGCGACHVPYADDGLSTTRDPTVDKFEPGHPKKHEMVRFPDVDACARCHYGDASIGLSYRGLAQPVPGMPQTPDAPGLHRKRLNGVYYIDDPASTPADVHHFRGMHCVDCHTRNDVMGDGFLYGRMEDAVETTCEGCHGTHDEYATGLTRRGTKIPNLVKKGTAERPEFFLEGRIDGKQHRVKQSRDVVRPGGKDFNQQAALAMTDDHRRLECYACHSGWNPNFFGFHFDRNEQFTQLDLLSGQRTEGRVTTQEKVFSTFKSFYLGWNSHGRVAPYMVGFSTMATVHDEKGELVLDQALPVTRAGLSGMTMIHHQTHTTTARARHCVECHRAPATFGRGSSNFRIMRSFIATGGDTGVRLLSLDRKAPGDTALLSALPVNRVRAMATVCNRVTGRCEWVYAASPQDGLVVCDVSSPGFPRVVATLRDGASDPQALVAAASKLYLADGADGVAVFDVSTPSKPRQIARVAEVPAYGLWLDGSTLHVAAGARGLAAIDVSDPKAPVVVSPGSDLSGESTNPVFATRVAVLFQYSRPNQNVIEAPRTTPRALAVVGTRDAAVWLVDVTEPAKPVVLAPARGTKIQPVNVHDVALSTIYALGSEGGAIPTEERDYAFVLFEEGQSRLILLDVTDAAQPKFAGTVGLRAQTRSIRVARVYNPPFLQTFVVATGQAGTQIVDVSKPDDPKVVASINQPLGGYVLDLEEFPLDKTVDADGKPIMDVSHEGARWLDRAEFERVLGVPTFWSSGFAPGGTKR